MASAALSVSWGNNAHQSQCGSMGGSGGAVLFLVGGTSSCAATRVEEEAAQRAAVRRWILRTDCRIIWAVRGSKSRSEQLQAEIWLDVGKSSSSAAATATATATDAAAGRGGGGGGSAPLRGAINDGRLEVVALDRAWGCLGPAQSSNHAATTADVGWDDSMTAAMAEPAACSSGTANLRDGMAQCWRWQEHREMLATAYALNTSRFFNRSESGSGCRACSHGSSGDGMAHLQLPYLLHIRNRDYLELSDFRGVAAATWGALSFLARPAAVQLNVGTPIAFVLAPSNFSHVAS